MHKALKWKLALVMAMAIAAIMALVPTVFTPDRTSEEEPPSWLENYNKVWDRKLSLGLDLQGGLLLQYKVEVTKAVRDKVDRIDEDMRKRLVERDSTLVFEGAGANAITRREGLSAIYIKFDDPSQSALLDSDLTSYFPNMIQSDAGNGEIRFDMDPEYIEETQDYAMEQAIGTIRERVDALGVAEPDIKKSGKSDIVVQLPGLGEGDFERAKRLIGTTAQLEFKLVDEGGFSAFFTGLSKDLPPKSETSTLEFDNQGGQPTIKARTKDELKKFFEGKVPEDKQVVFEHIVRYTDDTKEVVDKEKSFWRTSLVFSRTELTGEYITTSQISTDSQTNKPYVSLTFDSTGAELFGKITTENVKKRFAILLDDELKSDPVINEPIPGGRAQINMGGYKSYNEIFQESKDLTIVLRHGALPAPIHKEFETSVGPSLGADSIAAGQRSLIVASFLVIFFMLLYYRSGGLIANLALTLNVIFIMAGLTALNATLTLPGIAGIILTIGMAVDANVIIFERVREEIRMGKGPKAAIDAGYGKALSAVLDANITTGIAGIVLMQYGSGPIRGFAITLLIGIIASVFTAVVVTRLCFDIINDRFKPATLSI
jgi:preprotein translocase subunit SecD